MKATSEMQAIAAVAERYRSNGYEIQLDAAPFMPAQLGNYRPDFLARKGTENIAVEVKSRAALGQRPELQRVAEVLRCVPGWRLDVAFLEEKSPPAEQRLLAAHEIRERLGAAAQVASDTQDFGGAILLLWTCLEALLRSHLGEEGAKPQGPARLVKLAYSAGIIDDEEMEFLGALAEIRNEIVHGLEPSITVDLKSVKRAAELATTLLELSHDYSEAK